MTITEKEAKTQQTVSNQAPEALFETSPIRKTGKSRNTKATESDLWLDYLIELDPNDESGSFLTPDDLRQVDQAYLRLQASGTGIPKSPVGKKTTADHHDDSFIKRKMALAFSRAIPELFFSSLGDERSIEPTERKTNKHMDWHTSLEDDLLPTAKMKVLSYEQGYISGFVKVLFPKSSPKLRIFLKEKGWRTKFEFTQFNQKIERTIYARGLCMNVLVGAVTEDITEHIILNSQIDNTNISFEPIAMVTIPAS